MTEVKAVRDRIDQAAAAAGRPAAEITLIGVSKTKPVEAIRAAYAEGLRDFGENRAEELAEKRAALADLSDIRWHFIGRLQSRQAPIVTTNADTFHAVDRLKIAEALAKRLERNATGAKRGSHQVALQNKDLEAISDPTGSRLTLDRAMPVFVQVNVSGEATKAGFEASDWETDPNQRAALCADIAKIAAMAPLQIQGLMTMAPFDIDHAQALALFRRVQALSAWLQRSEGGGFGPWPSLSMGMSGDFEAAIAAGATHLRIGGAIFGARG